MSKLEKHMLALEITICFARFYSDNLASFREKYGVACVNGSVLTYDDMLPDHVKNHIIPQQEMENVV